MCKHEYSLYWIILMLYEILNEVDETACFEHFNKIVHLWLSSTNDMSSMDNIILWFNSPEYWIVLSNIGQIMQLLNTKAFVCLHIAIPHQITSEAMCWFLQVH